MAAEVVVYEDQTHLDEYEEVEAAILEELLQEAEVAALEQELSDHDPDPLDEDSTVEEPDHPLSEESDTSSHEESSLLDFSETEVDDVNGSIDLDWVNLEVIEVVEEEVFEEFSDMENLITDEVGVEEQDSTMITVDEEELNTEAQELLGDQTEDKLETLFEENEVHRLEDVVDFVELEHHDDFIEPDDIEDVLHQNDLEEIPDVEELAQYDEYTELEEETSTPDDLFDLEETDELQTVDQADVANLQDKQEEARCEEDLIDNIEENLDEKIEEQTNHFDHGEQEEELTDSQLEIEKQLEEPDTDYIIEEQQPATLTDASVSADIETLEKEFSPVSDEYQSVFTPHEQFVAHFMADMLLFETIQTDQERHTSSSTVSEKHDLSSISPYSVSLNEELLPPISLDQFDREVSTLEEELALFDSPRAFQHFHEQLQESHLQALSIDLQLSLENIVDDLGLVSQGEPLPDPPPYDFLAELESYEDDEVAARYQELKNPLYPYSNRRHPSRPINIVKAISHQPAHTKAVTKNPESQKSKSEPHGNNHKVQSLEQQPIPVVNNKSRTTRSQRIPSEVLDDLKVPSTRGVVKQQIEALNKLLSLDHKIIYIEEPIRVITLKASNRKEMGEVFWAKLGDFTQESDVLKYGKRCFVKLKKEPNWRPLSQFLSIVKNRAHREVHNPELDKTAWVIHNKKKGWEYTGNQRIITEVKMNRFNIYYNRLEERARILASDTDQTRIHLSKYDKNSLEYKDRLTFWSHYGYYPPEITKIYLTEQQPWSVSNVALNGLEILLKTLRTGRLSNSSLSKNADSWSNTHRELKNSSRIVLRKQGKQLTLNEILPEELVNELQKQKVDIDSLHENRGAPYVFKSQLEKIKNDLRNEVRNVISEYLNISKTVVENSNILVDWGIIKDRSKVLGMDKYNQEFRYTFAPDIVVEDQHGKIIAVIQLKGLSQDQHALSATSSVFQMIELFKYHLEHEVPVALVNIKHVEEDLRYEWLIIGKAHTPPSPLLQQLIDPQTGLDPIIPRNARSVKFVEEIHQEFITNDGLFNIEDKVDDFRDLVNESQLQFQNLCFYKDTPKDLDVLDYWEGIVEEFYKRKISEPHRMKFKEFYQIWKKIIVTDYEKRLKTIEIK